MATRLERFQADLVKTENLLEKANITLESLVESEMEDYEIENADSRQKVRLQKISNLQKLITYLENKREKLYNKINGNGYAQSLRLRRR